MNVERFHKYKIPKAPKLIKVPKKATVNRLNEIEAINSSRVAKFETKLANLERKARLQDEKIRQRKARQAQIAARREARNLKKVEVSRAKVARRQAIQDQMNALLVKAADQGKEIMHLATIGKYCEAKPLIMGNCSFEKKYKSLNKRLDPKAIPGRSRLRRR